MIYAVSLIITLVYLLRVIRALAFWKRVFWAAREVAIEYQREVIFYGEELQKLQEKVREAGFN